MMRPFSLRWLVPLALVLLLLPACSDSGDGAADTTLAPTTTIEAATTTTIDAATTTQAAAVTVAPVATVEVSFDGSSCSVSPQSVPAGDTALLFTNTSDIDIERTDLYVGSMPDGHTLESLHAMHASLGGPPNVIPDSDWYIVYDAGYEPVSFTPPPDIEMTEDQWLDMRTLTTGTDFVELYVHDASEGYEVMWICDEALEVTS
jgi:hypothetical protein